MDDGGWKFKIDADGTWLCEHRERDDHPAKATRLRLSDATVENPEAEPHRRRRYLFCPDCGTSWRAWEQLNVAKQYVAPLSTSLAPFNAGRAFPKYLRLRNRAIDQVLKAVVQKVPSVEIIQHSQSWPADDDGLWFFNIPGNKKGIQIESWTGECPFVIEHSDMKASTEAIVANSINDVVKHVVDYLQSLQEEPRQH